MLLPTFALDAERGRDGGGVEVQRVDQVALQPRAEWREDDAASMVRHGGSRLVQPPEHMAETAVGVCRIRLQRQRLEVRFVGFIELIDANEDRTQFDVRFGIAVV